MPRDPKVQAMKSLGNLHKDYESARRALEDLTSKRRAAIVKAVEAGNTKAAVGREVGVSAARVSALVKEA
jgi:DNA-directed RNA polymerase specialized sigma24 family protein